MVEEPLPEQAFVPHGEIAWNQAQEVKTFEDFVSFAAHTRFSYTLQDLADEASAEDKLSHIGKKLGEEYTRFLGNAQSGEIDGIQVSMGYFKKRLQNARMLKYIMFAKFHGLDSESIYAGLKNY